MARSAPSATKLKIEIDDRKWVQLRDACDGLSTAAKITLENRIGAVEKYLPLAARHHRETAEYVHQLRVSTRRALAALVLYGPYLPGKHAKWMRRQMKRIRKAAGEARDLDVLMIRYEGSSKRKHHRLIKRLKKLRRKSQNSIKELDGQLIRSGRLRRRSKKLVHTIERRRRPCLKDFAREQIRRQTLRFADCTPEVFSDVAELHRFRVQAKEFRYTIELLNDMLPKRIRRDVYPIVCKTQELLGDLNDHAIASRKLGRLGKKEHDKSLRKRLKMLSVEEQEQVEQARLHFHQWWTDGHSSQFAMLVDSILDDGRKFDAAG